MPRNVLLLQGPVGPFFQKFSRQLESRGHNVLKVNLNGGDLYYYRRGKYLNFTSAASVWPAWIESIMVGRDIDRIYLFGDCRRYHRQAIGIARRLGIDVYVFEEGYVRPNYVTLEKDGVNGFTSACEKNTIHECLDETEITNDDVPSEPVSNVFRAAARHCVQYYLAASILRHMFKNYEHHRSLNVVTEGLYWIQSGLRKITYSFTERKIGDAILSGRDKYFLLPLQVHSDMQVRQHSEFSSIEKYLEHVISSFSKSDCDDCLLVIKHHPYDRGYKSYRAVIKKMALVYGLENRIHYVHDTDLPSLLQKAEGSVLINSTVGISSLYHDTPVKALGEAIYDIEGLTFQGSLESFWNAPGEVDRDLFKRFRRYLIDKTQINGSLYTDVKHCDQSGLNWPVALSEEHFSEVVVRSPAVVDGEAGSIIDLEEHKKNAEISSDQPGYETATKKIAI